MSRLVAALLCVTALGCPASTSSAAGGDSVVVMQTSMGTVRIQLEPAKAPLTAKNFLSYVDSGFYDQTVFHRVINNFMIQGGGFTETMVQKPTQPPVKNESSNGLKNLRGTIAMARTPDPNSATSQFFINVKDNPMLDYPNSGGYTVFGKVIEGMDVVDKIKVVPTGAQSGKGDVPLEPVVIVSMKRAP